MYEHMNKPKLNKKGLPKKNFDFFLKRLHERGNFRQKSAHNALKRFACRFRMVETAPHHFAETVPQFRFGSFPSHNSS
ncbi:hypothetical protein SAMN04488109_4830 [Chryseolinea serpens]|uniref:Uncharacterized protein n=1 Tax=Chryseolinea serpens TaxID=947013 RepID=A0A1M5UQ32_9BACT|nr:hypothetical protein SAMN04488109_4830 [Chryseolinea serpens]